MASHGTPRTPYSKSIRTAALREEELQKIKEYNALVAKTLEARRNGVCNQESLDLTTKVLNLNPEFVTVWNYRMEIVLKMLHLPFPPNHSYSHGRGNTGSSEFKVLEQSETPEIRASEEGKVPLSIEKLLTSELALLFPLLKSHPKCYVLWNYRLWLLSLPNVPPDLSKQLYQTDLGLATHMLSRDSRNFHGWAYRRIVVGEIEKCTRTSMVEKEFEYTTQMIMANMSNFSAWHNRSKLAGKLLRERGAEMQDRMDFLEDELELLKKAIITKPGDQSLWLYLRWLIWSNASPPNATNDEKDKNEEGVEDESVIAPNLPHSTKLALVESEIDDLVDMLNDAAEEEVSNVISDIGKKWILVTLVGLIGLARRLRRSKPPPGAGQEGEGGEGEGEREGEGIEEVDEAQEMKRVREWVARLIKLEGRQGREDEQFRVIESACFAFSLAGIHNPVAAIFGNGPAHSSSSCFCTMPSVMEAIDPTFAPLPVSAIHSLNNSPTESIRLPHIPVHPPPGIAPLPHFRSERLLPAPNMIYPLPPTYANISITPQCKALQGKPSTYRTPRSRSKPRVSPDRFIPSSTSISAFRMSTPLHLLSRDEKLLRRSSRSDVFGRGRSASPSIRSSPTDYRRRQSPASGITAVGRAIYVGAGSSRGTEININIYGNQESPEVERERHESRLAAALGVDRCARVLSFIKEPINLSSPVPIDAWSIRNENSNIASRKLNAKVSQAIMSRHAVPSTPFRVLDAPGLRDDYYCSLLAYSPITRSLAVGLHSDVYIWTETTGATPFERWSSKHVTCLAFSSTVGRRNILAIGRIDGNLCLWKPGEVKPRIERLHTAGVACLSWRPCLQKRWDASFSAVSATDQEVPSRLCSSWVDCEDLLVGDELGVIYYYTILWDDDNIPPVNETRTEAGGAKARLLKKIVAHTQQICGLCWSGDGTQFATGGNDNVACLFNVHDIFMPALPDESRKSKIRRERGRYRWVHGAAVKAMAFCPWQKNLLATGGGSNDRCIHFYHTYSGACLATINVSAQVTSLLWSNSHREIAATFGYANPDHPIRIAVFSWPECKQVAAIPWGEDMRALYAVGYPGGPMEDITEDDDAILDDLVTEEDSEEEWARLGRRVLARSTSTSRPQADNATLPAAEGTETPRGRALTVPETAIPTTTAARTNTNSRSRSRGRPVSRLSGTGQQRSTGTRNSSSAAQAASLRRRRTRSGRASIGDGGRAAQRHSDGCIVVAASDETVRFHEVWSECRKGVVGWRGVLGGSDILEGLEGIEKDGGEMIR